MNIRKKFLILLLVTIVLFTASSFLEGYERKQLLPPKTGIIVRISDTTTFFKAIEDSPLGQLWNSPRMKAFINNGKLGDALIKDFFSSDDVLVDAGTISRLESQSLGLLKHELIIGVTPGEHDQFSVMAAMSEEDYQKSLQIDKQLVRLKKKKTVFKEHRFHGVTIIEEIETDDQESISSWQAFYQGTLFNTLDRQWLEKSIIRLKDESPEEVRSVPTIDVAISGDFIRRTFSEMLLGSSVDTEEKENVSAQLGHILGVLGLSNIKSLNANLVFKPGTLELEVTIHNPGEMQGLFSLFKKEAVPYHHKLVYVPDDAVAYSVSNLDINRFWQEIPIIIGAFNPQFAQQFQQSLVTMTAMMNADISSELFANLDTLVTTYSRLDDLSGRRIYFFQLRDSQVTEKFLAKIFAEDSIIRANFKQYLEVVDFSGFKIYIINNATTGKPGDKAGKGEPDKKNIISTGITVADNALIMGDEKMLRAYLQASNASDRVAGFYDTPLFKTMIRKIPDNATGYGIFDMNRWVRSYISLAQQVNNAVPATVPSDIKNGSNNGPNNNQKNDSKNKKNKRSHFNRFVSNLRFDKLPSPHFIASFFGKTITFSQVTNQGMTITGILFHPPKKRIKK